MRVPMSWLREYVDVDLAPEQLAERLTLLGMEVQGIERIGEDWRSVVVGELLDVAKHPGSDPPVADPRARRRRHGAVDRVRRHEHRGRPARARGAARRRAAGRSAHRGHAHRGRREPRHALLGRRAGA